MVEIIEKSSGKIKSFDGSTLYYETRGKGEAIVFVYGIACLMNHWHHQIKYFSKNFCVITFDIRGHHQSNPITNPQNINISSAAKDINSLLESLGISAAHFVGHSFGAPIIFSAFNQFPEKFLSISLINGFSRNPIKGMFGLDVIEPFFHFFKKQFQESPIFFTQLWKWAVYNPISMRAAAMLGGFNLKLTHFKDIEVYAKGVAHLDIHVFLSFFEDMMNFDGDMILKKIDVPTLIISGDEDNVTPKAFQTEMATKIKGSELVRVPYGSHCTQLDFPDYINLKIENFINKLKTT